MEVYIEVVILNNLVVDLFLLCVTLSTCQSKISFPLVLLSASIGAAFAVFAPYMNFSGAYFLKLTFATVMTATCKRYSSFKEYLGVTALFCAYSFLLGGIAYAVGNALGTSFAPALLGGAMLLCLLVARRIARHFAEVKRQKKYAYDLTLYSHGRSVECKGYLDSGNRLFYRGDRPVIIIDTVVACELFDPFELCECKAIAVKTLAGQKKLKLVNIDRIDFCDEGGRSRESVSAAVGKVNIKGYGVLLHCDI